MQKIRSHSESGDWPALCLRLAVITLPALLIGAFLGFVPTMLLGPRTLSVPWVPSLVLVGMGAATGLAIGLLARPPRDRFAAALAVAAGYGLAGFLILRLLVQIRLPAGASTAALTWVIGGLVVVTLQSIIVGLLWRRRAAQPTRPRVQEER